MPDYYLTLKVEGEDIKGESMDSKHEEWIELLSLSHSLSQGSSGSASSGGATPEGRCHHGDIIVTKMLDASSLKLYLALSKGALVNEATIELCRSTGEKTCYMKYLLKNGFISDISLGGGGDIPTETIALRYTEIEWEYKQLNPDDFSEKTTIGHKWNCKDNTGS